MKIFALALATSAAALTLVLATAALIAIDTGRGLGAPPLGFAFSYGYDLAADRELAPGNRPDMPAAEANSLRALQLSPYDNVARLRLAALDTYRRGWVTQFSQALIAQSYALVPVDVDTGPWRVQFALGHWTQMSPANREQVRREGRALATIHTSGYDLGNLIKNTRDPSGRAEAESWAPKK